MIIFRHMLSFMWRRFLEREAPYHAYYDSCRFLAVKTFHGTSENQSWNSGSSDRHLQWPNSHVSRDQRSAKPFSCPQLASAIFPSHYTCSHGCPLLLEVQWEEILFKALHLIFKKFPVLSFVFNIVIFLRLLVSLVLTLN